MSGRGDSRTARARFWIDLPLNPDAPWGHEPPVRRVRLSLAPGDVLEWDCGYRHEEGGHWEWHEWSHDVAPDGTERLLWAYSDRDTDCDGRFASNWTGWCDLRDLAREERDGIRWPRWRTIGRGQRDYRAEAAGY